MSREASAFADSSPEASEARRSLPFAEWCHLYLPHWFSCDDAPCHAEADERRNTVGTILAEDWAREMAKTTRYSIADVLYDVCNETQVCRLASGEFILLPKRDVPRRAGVASSVPLVFILLLAASHDKAAERMDLIRTELRHNARLRADYGDRIEPSLGSDAEDDWTANGVCVRGFGTGESLRSQLYNGHRPQKAVADDLENNVIARNQDREQALRDWVLKDVYPALEGGGQQAVFRILLNHFGRHCLAAYLRGRAEEKFEGQALVIYVRNPRRDEEGNSTWRARHSDLATRRLAAIIGPSRARTELDCLDDDEGAKFHVEWIKTFHVALLEPAQRARMRKIIWLDGSYKAKETSDFKCVVEIGRARRELEVFCLHAWLRKVPSREAAMEIVRTWQIDPDAVVYIEDAGGAEESFRDIFAGFVREGLQVPCVHYEPTTEAKEDSIGKWEGLISQGLGFFDLGECDQGVLVNQLLDWPHGKNDDGPDAWSKAMAKLGRPDFGDGQAIRVGMPRTDYSAVGGVKGRTPPMPGSDEEADEREDRESHSLSRFAVV
jgi:hypothetical protein